MKGRHRHLRAVDGASRCRGPFQDLLGKGPAFAVMDMVNYRNLLDPDEMTRDEELPTGIRGHRQ